MIRYLNIKTKYGVETWETVNRQDFNSYKEFIQEIKSLKKNYSLIIPANTIHSVIDKNNKKLSLTINIEGRSP